MACMPTNGTKIGSPGVTMSKQVENSHGSALLLTLFGALIGIMACSFLLFIGLGYWLESVTSLQPISRARAAFYFEPMVLTLSVLTLAIITRRLFVSAFIVSGLYVVFMLINAEMMRMFGLVFSPIDIKHSAQVFIAPEVWMEYWLELLMTVLLLVVSAWMVLKTRPNPFLQQYRYYGWAVLLVAGLSLGFYHNRVAVAIDKIYPIPGKVKPINLSERNGYLFAFYYRMLNHRPVAEPTGYSRESIARIAAKYSHQTEPENPVKPDVIILFVEAFADPQQLGIETSFDPIPQFRKYASKGHSGLVLSPELGGRSANPEFELLTGLSMRFLPGKSIPYIDYVNQSFPSLAREFKANGYQTRVLHVASMSFFNYLGAYPQLGFDRHDTLFRRKDVVKDKVGRYPSENALIDEIIKLTTNTDEPAFIFSFPNSTHGPWDYEVYDQSELEVYGDYLEDGKQHLRTYINALHEADKAIGRLIAHYEQQPQPTVIMVLGDHQPGLPEFRQSLAINYFKETAPEMQFESREELKKMFVKQVNDSDESTNGLYLETYRKSHQVPYFIWTNFDDQTGHKNTSMNLLSAQLLKVAGVRRSPLYNLVTKIHQQLGELDKKTPVAENHRALVHEYELLHHDIISGERYYQPFIDRPLKQP